MTPFHSVLLLSASLVAGAINSVAGGGTLLTFPVLLAMGVPPILANGTSTAALVPGSLSAFWGYRAEMGRGNGRDLLWMGLPSLVGGFFGALLAIKVGDTVFSRLVPWLIFGATLLFLVQEPIRRWVAARTQNTPGDNSRARLAGAVFFQFFVAIYGGFFGAGMGIVMLAALGILGQTNIHRMNGLKTFAAVCINGVGALTFIFCHRVNWHLAPMMALAAILGGYGGAGMAQRIGQANVRRIVIAIGLLAGLWTAFGPYLLAHLRK